MFFKKKKKNKDERLTQEEFLEMIKEKLPKHVKGLKVSYASKYSLSLDYENNNYVFSYPNEYSKYLDNPDSTDEILEIIKSDFFEHIKFLKVDIEKIYPVIETKEFVKENIIEDVELENVVYHQLNEELFVIFFEKRGDSKYPIQKSHLKNLGYTPLDLFNKASENLANLPDIISHNTNGLVQISAGGEFESSLIILNLLLRQQYYSVPGDIVVALPTRNTFFLTGSEDLSNLLKLREIIKDLKNEGNVLITDKLFRLNDYNNFVVFDENSSNTDGFLSQDEFAEIIIKKLIQKIEGVKIVYHDRLHIVTEYRGQKINYKYYKCYDDYVKHPEKLESIINSYFNVTYDAHMHAGVSIDPSKIFPIIRNKGFREKLSESEPESEKIIFDSCNEELFVFYIVDRDHSMYFIREADMLNLNYSKEELKTISIQNLTADWDVSLSKGEGLHSITSNVKYVTSLILVDMWGSELIEVMGDPVVTIVNPKMIYVTGSNDQANLFRIYDYIRTVKQEAWQPVISDKLFVYRNHAFHVFE
ncbi:DUF1444 family protein [Flavobacterium gelatinilyticum]|uniref:DUF1444 family protein n=1 Tax=Flavobacterium gelatinilyticum TaxID=3003260 RepID=UPI0024815F4D|nr:DUF1444 family protein [Flavobacterium gelatinilyticum]